jgi:phosphoribosylformylglycinamidine synthase
LRIPEFVQAWEKDFGKPDRIASALQIMIEGPIGAAAFNNEFGRPNILGYFRTYEQEIASTVRASLRGYHKPIMIAGGLGNIRRDHVEKSDVIVGAQIVVLGGPALLRWAAVQAVRTLILRPSSGATPKCSGALKK